MCRDLTEGILKQPAFLLTQKPQSPNAEFQVDVYLDSLDNRWRLSWNRTGLSSPMMWAVTLKHEFSVPLCCCLHPAAVG
ncbi:C2 Domain-Containing Protein 5 [Manis pentadactyla]|nr:C2 Domain-Containing Protein 5 [Manis pentadactyla]